MDPSFFTHEGDRQCSNSVICGQNYRNMFTLQNEGMIRCCKVVCVRVQALVSLSGAGLYLGQLPFFPPGMTSLGLDVSVPGCVSSL